MNKVKYISVAILLAAASLAQAETTTPTTPLPGDKGLASVNKNLEKNPDNKGLKNASERLQQNRLKHAEQAQKRNEKHEMQSERKMERIETRAERHEGMGQSGKPERPGK